jgi:16S rRNA (cytidine1402-2'-O)-methyltransferase
VIVVGPPLPRAAPSVDDIDAALAQALQTQSVRDAAATVASAFNQPRREVYTRALALAKRPD